MVKRPRLRVEDFKYLPDLKKPFPQLVLGVKIDPECFDGECLNDYRFKRGREWIKIAHQSGAMMCHQHYYIGTILTPKSVEISEKMRQLVADWANSNAGVFGTTLTEINEYSKNLWELFGANCNSCYTEFEEGHYPIDLEYLPALAADATPPDLDDFIDWDSGFERARGCIRRFRLVILGENSD